MLTFHQGEERPCPATLEALAAWLRHVRGDLRPVDDPLADGPASLCATEGRHGIARARFGAGGLFAQDWQASQETLEDLERRLREE